MTVVLVRSRSCQQSGVTAGSSLREVWDLGREDLPWSERLWRTRDLDDRARGRRLPTIPGSVRLSRLGLRALRDRWPGVRRAGLLRQSPALTPGQRRRRRRLDLTTAQLGNG